MNINDPSGKFTGWCRGLITKYPAEVMAIMAALCEAGLRKGTISANDIANVSYSDPHVVGATFKAMKRIGFTRSDKIVASTRPKSNASFVLVWDLIERWKAEAFLGECRRLLVGQEQKQEQQTLSL